MGLLTDNIALAERVTQLEERLRNVCQPLHSWNTFSHTQDGSTHKWRVCNLCQKKEVLP